MNKCSIKDQLKNSLEKLHILFEDDTLTQEQIEKVKKNFLFLIYLRVRVRVRGVRV